MSTLTQPRLPADVRLRAALAADVHHGLGGAGQKTLPSKYLYDDVGSLLFDAITYLPEYGLTAADARLLERHATAILAPFAPPMLVAELGSGSGRKTRFVLEAAGKKQFTTYYPIEISALALQRCQVELAGIAGLSLRPLRMEYLEGLARVRASRPRGHRLLVLFLGSSLGNLDAEGGLQLLAAVRRRLEPGDGILVGVDLEKPEALLRLAYDDPAGVTAAFNLNLLARLNRELDATFDLSRFRHLARWNAAERRVEMHLETRQTHTVEIPGAEIEVHFAAGETIWTESCHKYLPGEMARLAAATGFQALPPWTDTEWGFTENLLIAE